MSSVEMVRVVSTSVAAVGYDAEARELYVRFRDGGTYAYEDVPPRVVEELLRAESKGGYVNTVVKPNHAYRAV